MTAHTIRNSLTLLYSAVFFISFSVPTRSCVIPVFRYALERWPAEPYEIIVFYRDSLSLEEKITVDWLEHSSAAFIPHTNYIFRSIDVASMLTSHIQDLWESLDQPEPPCFTVHYPQSVGFTGSIWTEPLTRDAVGAVIDSPLRQEIARMILDGASSVWVLLESGNRSQDDAAVELLQSELSKMKDILTLSGQDVIARYRGEQEIDNGKLRIEFPLIRLSRSNKAESFFVAMLMHSEPDLFDYESYPMAFPIYGRGRVLYALVGNGINEQTISETCAFVIGECSCMVKALNPGLDILMPVNWEDGIEERWIDYLSLPPLIGLSELAQAAGKEPLDTVGSSTVEKISITADLDTTIMAAESIQTSIEKSHEDPSYNMAGTSHSHAEGLEISVTETTSNLLRNILVAFGTIIVIVALISLKFISVKTEHKP